MNLEVEVYSKYFFWCSRSALTYYFQQITVEVRALVAAPHIACV